MKALWSCSCTPSLTLLELIALPHVPDRQASEVGLSSISQLQTMEHALNHLISCLALS